MAFQGIVSSTISNENSVQGTVANAVYLTATPASVKYIIGTSTNINLLSGTVTSVNQLTGVPGLNVLEVIDVYDYFRTEDNKHFLVTEDGNYLVI